MKNLGAPVLNELWPMVTCTFFEKRSGLFPDSRALERNWVSRRVTPSFFPWGFHFRQGLQNFPLYTASIIYNISTIIYSIPTKVLILPQLFIIYLQKYLCCHNYLQYTYKNTYIASIIWSIPTKILILPQLSLVQLKILILPLLFIVHPPKP